MKKTILTIIIAGLCATGFAQGYKISGEVKNFTGTAIRLKIAKEHVKQSEEMEIPVKQGVFSYEGKAASPYQAYLSINDSVMISFMLYNENIRITADAKNKNASTVKGGPQCDQYNEYLQTIQPLDQEIGALWKKKHDAGEDSPEAKALDAKLKSLQDEQLAKSSAFIQKYPQSGTSTYLFWRIYGRIEMPKAIELFDGLDKTVLADNSYYKFVAPTMIGQKNTAVGCKVPSMAQETPDGKTLSLDDFRGKYVLIDFWASWCVPCRAANPGIVEIYNKFKDKNFTILGISLDKAKDKWIEAIEKDGLNWNHISDLKFWDNEISRTFGVNSIPATVLVDPNGIIIARNLHKEELEQLLSEKLYP